jgi:hypothetical protein
MQTSVFKLCNVPRSCIQYEIDMAFVDMYMARKKYKKVPLLFLIF